MRRLFVLLLPALFIAAGGLGSAPPASGQAAAPNPREDARRGLVYAGLQRAARTDACRGNFRVGTQSSRGLPVCTHGPDPAPEGVDVTADVAAPATAAATAATPVTCVGNGTDGYRVQLIYARASDKADGYADWLPSLQQYAAAADDVFNFSAAETGGTRHVRYVHDASCIPVIDNVVLTTRGDDSFDNMLQELRGKGYSRSDRKYLVWMDANVYCGIAQVYSDDVPGQENTSNGQSTVQGEVARVDKGCWGQANAVEAHELVHVLGGVQLSAPNATPGFHCTDNYDRLCYDDGSGAQVNIVCADFAHENRLDCNHDDYYSTAAPPGSYLDTHWNVANSRFLTGTGGGAGSTTTTTRPPATTTTTSRFPPWWPTTTTRPPSTTTTTRPPSTTTTSTTSTTSTTVPPGTTTTSTTTTTTSTTTTTIPPPGGTVPSAPGTLLASQPPGTATGILLMWSPPVSPGNPPATAYRIYRGAGPTGLTQIAEVGSGATTYTDGTAVSRLIYWYYVTAVNSVGESPPSNLNRTIAK